MCFHPTASHYDTSYSCKCCWCFVSHLVSPSDTKSTLWHLCLTLQEWHYLMPYACQTCCYDNSHKCSVTVVETSPYHSTAETIAVGRKRIRLTPQWPDTTWMDWTGHCDKQGSVNHESWVTFVSEPKPEIIQSAILSFALWNDCTVFSESCSCHAVWAVWVNKHLTTAC